MLLQQVRLSIIRPINSYYLVTFREATGTKNRIAVYTASGETLYTVYLRNKDVKTTATFSH